MAKSNASKSAILRLLFNGTPIAGLADNASISPLTTLYVSLHTSDPLLTSLTGSEVSYTGYARQGVPRNTAGWIVTGESVSPVNGILFPQVTDDPYSAIATYAAISTTATGNGLVLYSGAISAGGIILAPYAGPTLFSSSTITEG